MAPKFSILTLVLFVFLGIKQPVKGQNSENFDYESLLDTIYKYRDQDIEKYRAEIVKLILKSEKNNDYYLCQGYRELGFYYIVLTEYERALVELAKSEEIANRIENESLLVETLMFKGLVQIDLFEYSKALKTYKRARDLSKRLGRRINHQASIQGIAIIYQRSNDIDLALEYYMQCKPDLNLNVPLEKDGWWTQNIAELYYLKGELETSEYYYIKSLEIWDSLDMSRGEIFSNNGLAELYLDKGDLSAINYFKGALKENEKINIYPQYIRAYSGAAKYYSSLMLNKDSVVHYYKKVIDVAINHKLEYLATDAVDYAISNIQYFDRNLNYYLNLKINVQQKLLDVTLKDDIKIAAASEKLKNSETINDLVVRQNETFRSMIFILGIVGLCTLILLCLLLRNLKNLRYSKSTIRSQLDLIESQKLKLKIANIHLEQSNSILNSDLKNRNLELLNTKNVITKIENVSNAKDIDYIKSILRKEIDEEFWKENSIINRFKDQEIVKKLYAINDKLTNSDIITCSMIVNGLSTKDISKITQKSIDAVKTSRSRLRKKLNVDKSENLSAFLNRLSLSESDTLPPNLKKVM